MKFTFKAKRLAQWPENAVRLVLWRDVNPESGSNLGVIYKGPGNTLSVGGHWPKR